MQCGNHGCKKQFTVSFWCIYSHVANFHAQQLPTTMRNFNMLNAGKPIKYWFKCACKNQNVLYA